METAIGKAIDLVCEYTVVPIARQFKYAFCYKSFISDMKKARQDLENEKILIEHSVDEAGNNLKVISHKAKDWLKQVDETRKEVNNLVDTYEQDQATRSSCIGQILNPIARHHLGRKATKKKQTIVELLLNKPKPEDICYEPQASGIVNEETAAAAAQRSDDGIFQSSCWNEAMNKIMKALKDDTTKIVGLHGMGGVGKSMMINEVHLQVLKQHMFDEVATVEVKAEVDIMRIQEEIASALGLTFTKSSVAIKSEELRKRLLQKQNGQKKKTVLIILDDLWEKLELGRVGIPSSNDQVQIKLLLTSRDEHLLKDKMGVRDPIPLDVLSDVDALRMFKRVLELTDEDQGDKASKAAEIAPKCSGLPVVIMAIANALKNKVLKEWENTLQQLDVKDALSKLEVSYDYLPSEESKCLFLICGIIRGPRIQVRDLLKYTFGLGLYERKDIYTLSAAATELEKLLVGLKAASMLLKSDNLAYVKIHDRMRDLALKIVDRDRSEWVRFTLRADRCKIPRRFDASTVELLFSYCEEGDSQLLVPHSFFKDMKKLYVLEFTNLNGAFSLPSTTDQLDSLGNLETLCLHKCSLSDISMIGELKGLRILSFQGSDIHKIPIQLGELAALKMLDLSYCKELTHIEPNVLGSLTNLEELNMENSFKDWGINQEDKAQPSNARLIELKNMSRLNNVKLHIPRTSMLPKDYHMFLNKLTMYKIMLGDVWSWDIDAEQNNSRVLMLQFNDSSGVLEQDWVQATLQRTEVLYLSGRVDEKCESIDEICIKGFECLKHLRVKNCPSIRYIVYSNCVSNFMDLESLYIEDMENLEKLCNMETFGKLKVTKVTNCNKLTHLFDFSVLKCNSELEEIIIKDCKKIHCIIIDEDHKNYDVVELLKLHRLELKGLPKFHAFCVPQVSQPPMKALFSGKKVALPCLESLVIYKLNELEAIWQPSDPPTELGKLLSLHVGFCNNLVRVINSNVSIVSLESLAVNHCPSIKHVFDLRYKFFPGVGSFQLLKKIDIYNCRNIEAIIVVMMGEEETTHQKVAAIQYSSLKELKLYGCSKLKTLCWYSSSEKISENNMGQVPIDLSFFNQKETFPCLDTLELGGLKELRQIWPHEVVAAQRCFYKLKQVGVMNCPKLSAVLPAMLIDRLVKLESIKVCGCELIKSIIVDEKDDIKLTVLVTENMEMMRFTFPCLRHLFLIDLPKLDRFYSSSASVDFPSLEYLTISRCPKVKALFIQRPPTMSLVGADDDDLDSNGVVTALFGLGAKQAKSIPNLKYLNLDDLGNFTRIWKIRESDDKNYSDRIVPQHRLGAKVEDSTEFCIQKLDTLKLRRLPKLELSICISKKKCTTINNGSNKLPPYNEYTLLFPSLRELEVQICEMVKLFNSDSSSNQISLDDASTAIEHFVILPKKEIPSPLRSLKTSYENASVELEVIKEEHDYKRFGKQKQHFRLTLEYCKSSSCMNLLPLNSPSFCNVLTRLTVKMSIDLEYLFTPLGATSLVNLTYLSIAFCDKMKEVIVVAEEDEADINEKGKREDIIRDITFNHLKGLTLIGLPNLESFSSSSLNLNFPSLEDLTIIACHKMRIFCNGLLTTPNLHQADLDIHQAIWDTWTANNQSQLTEEECRSIVVR